MRFLFFVVVVVSLVCLGGVADSRIGRSMTWLTATIAAVGFLGAFALLVSD